MAAVDSAQSSTNMTSNNKNKRQSSPQLSKRDKKRQILTERSAVLTDHWNRDKDKTYREELQKIQVNVNLVGRVDPYADRPLDAIDREYRELSQATNGAPTNPNTRSLLEMAGPSFQEWVHQVEDLVETRDYELTIQKFDFDRKMHEHKSTHAYKIEVAKREHKLLSNTLRDRLTNTIISKKHRLGKEKEALDIADSSALFLHPNQFSLTHPASPGGTHGKRNTRLRREMEELPGFSENKKRKRNAGGDDDGSPAPARRGFDIANTTPLWQSDRNRILRKETGPIYSIDKLFTDKELSMTYNTAALASHKHMLIRRDANGNVLPSPEESDAGNGDANDEEDDPSAVSMERQPSHATRSTRGGHNQHNFFDDKILGIEALANFELPGNLDKMIPSEPKLPPLIHAQYSKAYVKSESNTPAALSIEDAQQDLVVMNIYKSYQNRFGIGSNLDVNNGGRRLLENLAPTSQRGKYAAIVQGPRPSMEALSESLGVPSILRENETTASLPGSLAQALAANGPPGGIPMSRQSSLGGIPMSRSGSARGKRR